MNKGIDTPYGVMMLRIIGRASPRPTVVVQNGTMLINADSRKKGKQPKS